MIQASESAEEVPIFFTKDDLARIQSALMEQQTAIRNRMGNDSKDPIFKRRKDEINTTTRLILKIKKTLPK